MTKDKGMKFIIECNGMELENGEEIAKTGEEGYKYLGILEKGDICQEEMKENITKEYFKRLRTTLKSKLNARHAFEGINTWVVPTVQYSAGIIEWTKKVSEGNGSKKKKDYHHVWWDTHEIKR